MAGGKFCLNRRQRITGAKHQADFARRERQRGCHGQAKGEEETTACDAHTSSLSRWPASVLTDCRKATLTSILSPPTPIPSLPVARARLSQRERLGEEVCFLIWRGRKRFLLPLGEGQDEGGLNSVLRFRLVEKFACFFVRWLS